MKKQKLHFSRLLSLALSLALLCTALSVPFSVSAANDTPSGLSTENPWDGDVATAEDLSLKDPSSTNSAANPYLIDCAEKLAYIARAGSTATNGKYYELTCDIYLNNVTDATWYDETHTNTQWFDTNAQTTIRFDGHLNGNGKKIYGLYINDSNRSNAGLFMQTKGDASVSNLGIENSYINAKSNVGAIFGLKDNFSSLSLSNCYSSDTVILTASGNYAGGLIGYLNIQGGSAYKNIIKNCYSSAQVAAAKDAYSRDTHGGLFGQIYAAENINISITNCYSTQSGTALLGCLPNTALLKSSGTFKNNYSTVWVGHWVASGSAENMAFSNNKFKNGTGSAFNEAGMTGELAYENMPGFDFNSVWHVFDGTPKLRVFGGINLEPEIWDGKTVATALNGGGTSLEDPYLISNGAELAYITNGATSGKYFKLVNDIYLNDISAEKWNDNSWKVNSWNAYMNTTDAFGGYLDGNGHTVYGIYITPDEENPIKFAGLFARIGSGATVTNLGISHSYIETCTYYNNDPSKYRTDAAGAIAGYRGWANKATTVSNCFVDETVTVKGYNAGAFIASVANFTGTTISNCYSKATLDGTLKGLLSGVDAAGATISNSYIVGYLLCNNNYDKVTYTDCYTTNLPWDNTNKVDIPLTGVTKIAAEDMVGDGMTAIATNANWVTNPKSTPKLAAFPIDGDVNGDKKVDICDLVLAKQVSLGSVTYKDINFATTNLDNSDNLYTINELDINKIRAGKLLGLDFQ